ncbi:hypothetical protein NA57DRAFT_80063 [Rhizodiscina lignyota]|uniref:Uncharacterized protein n=1 Tax=Rhizodiscina lignyota TaxID=1504668 RepID=A0A9P4I4M3_9PEZI|nr:hypothetical protein NA57DRAFT_80063 [Rhizodiscina lignyota]
MNRVLPRSWALLSRECQLVPSSITPVAKTRHASSKSESSSVGESPEKSKLNNDETPEPSKSDQQPARRKSVTELDEELKQKMAGIAGDGGDAGIELEDGQPVSMKRGVRENMFRYI